MGQASQPPGGGGLLQQAAQQAASVPPPAALQQPPGGAPQPGAAPPGAPGAPPETQPPGSPVPGPTVAQPTPTDISGMEMPGEDASPAEEEELVRAREALERILYDSDELSNSLMGQINPEDKIGTTTKATVLLINQIDDKIDLDESIIAPFTMEAVDRLAELAETRHGFEYTEQELQATLGATWEGVMAMFGVDENDYKRFVSGIGEDQMGQLKTQHEGFLRG